MNTNDPFKTPFSDMDFEGKSLAEITEMLGAPCMTKATPPFTMRFWQRGEKEIYSLALLFDDNDMFFSVWDDVIVTTSN